MTKAEAVVEWREALTRLSDQHFFDLVRMYLGAIKTPFNKQKIIESLSAFLRNAENRGRILACLDNFDREILAGIRSLPSPTRGKLVQLLSGSRSFPEVYERILNLEERLLIYRTDEEVNGEYSLNPLLADALEPHVSIEQLIRPETISEPVSVPLPLSDSVLAGLYGFFLHERPAVRNDGTLRKRTLDALDAAFPDLAARGATLSLAVIALRNLSLLCVHDGVLVPDRDRWNLFARCDNVSRIAYLCAAVYGRLTREALQRSGQSFLDLAGFLIPGGRYSLNAVSRADYLVTERGGAVTGTRSRFSRILQENNREGTGVSAESVPDRGETARMFGLLSEQDGFLTPNAAFSDGNGDLSATVYVSPSYEVVLMPGSSLAELLPLVSFMTVASVQTVGNYEINRKSCATAFDQGATAESILMLLEKHSPSPLPGNLLFSVRDWFSGYTALSLYHGYVLKVDDSRRILFEKNEELSRLVRKTLAPGVYLLDMDSPEELQDAASRAGLDFIPSVAMGTPRTDPAPLPPLRFSANTASGASTKDLPAASTGEDAEIRSALIYELEKMKPEKEQKEALLSRIHRKIIVSPDQLDPDSVRPEKLEARGVDFLGKVRIAEQASASGSLLEIQPDSGSRTLLGKPLSMEKKRGDVLVKLANEVDGSIETVSLSRAVLVRRIRGSIFSEPTQNR